MIARFEKGAQDGVALVRMLQPDALQVLKKDFLGLNAWIRVKGRHIVNPSLQHVLSQSPKKSQMKMNFIFIIPWQQCSLWSFVLSRKIVAHGHHQLLQPPARKGFFGIAFRIIFWILCL